MSSFIVPAGYHVDPDTGNIADASGKIDANLSRAQMAAENGGTLSGFTQNPTTGIFEPNTADQQAAQDARDAADQAYFQAKNAAEFAPSPTTTISATDSADVSGSNNAGTAAVPPLTGDSAPGGIGDVASGFFGGAANYATGGAAAVLSSAANGFALPSVSTIASNALGSAASLVPSSVSGLASSLLGKSGFSLTGGASAGGASATINTYKVAVQGPGGVVIFEASAPVTEDRTATYQGFDITHLPTDIPAYKNTSSRKFSITGKLVSRNAAEATANAGYLDLIRSWILPDYGATGATPPILKFYAYKNNNINGSQVILKNYSMSFPEDVDYIYTGSVPMPTITTLTLALDEVFSAEQITAGAWKIKPPVVNRPPDAFGNGDASFHATGGSSIGGITLGSIIPVATALAGVIKGGAGAAGALQSLSGFALGTAGSLIGSNPAIQSFVKGASAAVSSVVKTAESTVQGALDSATASVSGFVNSIGSPKGGAVASNLAPMSFGSGDASSSTPTPLSNASAFSLDSTNSSLG